ncbi:MAG: PHP-associated domain-containing protein [archaeon]
MLKADFHLHAKEDTQDWIAYTAKELVDLAVNKGFSVLSFTFHDVCFYPKELVTYARKKGILLLPGIEKTIEHKHVLLINYPLRDKKKIEQIDNFSTLRKYLNSLKLVERESLLTVFAHPRFWFIGMSKSVFRKNIDLADALEYQSFRHVLYDFNEDILRLASKYHKRTIGNTDAHLLNQFGHTYTNIVAKKEAKSIIQAIKRGKSNITSRSLSTMIVLARIYLDVKTILRQTCFLLGLRKTL